MAILLYCVTQIDGDPVRISAAVCDTSLIARDLQDVRIYFSDIRDAETCLGKPESLKQAAIQFHQVLRQILSATTPVSFRFPTLLESEEAIEQHMRDHAAGYRSALARVAGSMQYEITATWSSDEKTDTATPVSGREYLQRRRQSVARVSSVESKLKSVAGDTVQEWRMRQERKIHRWFALVRREHRERFLAALRTAGGSEGVRLRLSGPWPPSEFVEESRERE